MFKFENLKKTNTIFLLLILIICVIGGLTVFSTTYFPSKTISPTFLNQIIFYIIGFLIFFGLTIVNYKKFDNKYFVGSVFLISLLLLISVLIFGETIYNAKRWINFGFFTLQPSELVKISVILIAAFAFSFKEKVQFEKVFNIYEIKKNNFQENVIKIFLSENFLKIIFSIFGLITFAVLIMMQRSLGNTLLILLIYLSIVFMRIELNAKFIGGFVTILFGLNLSFNLVTLDFIPSINFAGFNILMLVISVTALIFISRIPQFKFIILLVLFTLLLFTRPILDYTYNNVIEDYQRNRIETFLNPNPTIALTEDYNRTQSIRAIGSGQIVGNGFLNGNFVKLGLLPFAFTDFAFAAYAEQFGFIGSIALVFLYFALITKILLIGYKSKDNFGKYVAYGVATMIFLNTAQHIGMNLGLVPITGVPLPLISSGGSAIITIFIGLGLVQSIEIINEQDQEEITNFKYDFGINSQSGIIKKV